MMVYASLKENHFWKASGHKHPLCGRTHTSMQVNTSRNKSICPIRLFCLSIIKLNDCVGCATGASCAVTPWRSELIAGSLTIIIRLCGGRRIHILNGAWACGNFLFLARRRRQWLRHTVSLAELDRCQNEHDPRSHGGDMPAVPNAGLHCTSVHDFLPETSHDIQRHRQLIKKKDTMIWRVGRGGHRVCAQPFFQKHWPLQLFIPEFPMGNEAKELAVTKGTSGSCKRTLEIEARGIIWQSLRQFHIPGILVEMHLPALALLRQEQILPISRVHRTHSVFCSFLKFPILHRLP